MSEALKLIIFETTSLPQGYRALQDLTDMGLEPLEFYPHADGVRILFRAPEGFARVLPSSATVVMASIKILKAMLSQTGNVLKKYLVVVETKKLSDLLKLASDFEKINAEILEIRALRSNHEKNYALFTVDNQDAAVSILKGTDHTILNSSSPALKEFLGFI